MFARQSRRQFLATTGLATTSVALGFGQATPENELAILPKGGSPEPLPLAHFPDRVHAFIWRNWPLVPIERLASVLRTSRANVAAIARKMSLPKQPRISSDLEQRSYITVIKRNWHLLPYDQLLELLGWNARELAYTLREDDFLFIKFGGLKPKCTRLVFTPATEATLARAQEISAILKQELDGVRPAREPLFTFVTELTKSTGRSERLAPSSDAPHFCYSYFALYGDPLLDGAPDPYPDGYLERLADCGVNGVWLQAVLYRLAPFPWDQTLSKGHEVRIRNLSKLLTRARKHGIGVYLYLNEPRAMPSSFFAGHPELKGASEGDHATLCTTQSEVRDYLTEGVASICRKVPELAGLFTITASENLTNCWSHGSGAKCPRCRNRSPGEVIAEVNRAIFDGITRAGTKTRLICWDWGWSDQWAEEAINRLPAQAMLQSVSEWDLPIKRGGIATVVGEYSISSVGPGPRARRHWQWAHQRGLKVSAKIQAGNTWELSAVPYIPAARNVAQHALNLHKAGVDGVMLGWTLGGYPSPNLELVRAVEEMTAGGGLDDTEIINRALLRVALRRYGKAATKVVQAWNDCSRAFGEFPYHIGVVYSAPLQVGPANLLWPQPTGYTASMVGLPYDDLERWRAVYPPEIFASQLEKVAAGFEAAFRTLQETTAELTLPRVHQQALEGERRVIRCAGIHFKSVANQSRFVLTRNALLATKEQAKAATAIQHLEHIIRDELELSRNLYRLQQEDSRIGFEASNQYYYVPIDLAEKVINCRHLLDRWLPELRRKHLT